MDRSEFDRRMGTRILQALRHAKALNEVINELQQIADTIEDAKEKADLQDTIEQMKEEKKDVMKRWMTSLRDSYDDNERRIDVEVYGPDNTARPDRQELIDQLMSWVRSNHGDNNSSGFGRVDDQEQMNSDHHFSQSNELQEIRCGRKEDKLTMIRWLKETDKSNEIEQIALKLGAHLSEIVVDLSVFMSERQDLKPKLQEFKSWLESLSNTNDCVVSRKILSLLEMAKTELEETKESKNELAAMEEDYNRYECSNKERLVEELLVQLSEEINCLGRIFGTPCPKEPLMSVNEVSLSMENALRQFEMKLGEVRTKVNELKNIFSSTVKNEDQKVKEFWKKMNVIISHQVWNQLEESGANIKRQNI